MPERKSNRVENPCKKFSTLFVPWSTGGSPAPRCPVESSAVKHLVERLTQKPNFPTGGCFNPGGRVASKSRNVDTDSKAPNGSLFVELGVASCSPLRRSVGFRAQRVRGLYRASKTLPIPIGRFFRKKLGSKRGSILHSCDVSCTRPFTQRSSWPRR